jgi:putative endonuclease
LAFWAHIVQRFRPNTRATLGRRGERLARKHLKKQGCRCLAKNWSCDRGEIDLIVLDDTTIVFVEVKTRRAEQFTDAESVVNYTKRQHITATAHRFIHANKLHDHPCRFDTVAVIVPDAGKPLIRHQRSAFAEAR